jgi:uncharacterized protein (DUF302 family)
MKAQTKKHVDQSDTYSYPAHKILCVFEDLEDARNALSDLKNAGFRENDVEVICKKGVVDISGGEQGFWGRIVHSMEYLGSKSRYLERFENELEEGGLILTVMTRNGDTQEAAKNILTSNGGQRLTYFGHWLDEKTSDPKTTEKAAEPYGYKRELETGFEESLQRVRATLMDEGFGVLTEIDMADKFREKLGVEFRKYVILGACNPPIAHSALQEDLDIGLLLPCNVIVYESNGGSVVAAIDAKKMLSVTANPMLESTAGSVNEKLRNALDNL